MVQIETEKRMYQPYSFFHKRRVGSSAFDDLHLELALFVDEAAYKTFSEFYKNDDTLTRDMILAYVNGVSNSSLSFFFCKKKYFCTDI